jgi:hypothetical protein
MKTIYLDTDFRCHVEDDGTMLSIETDEFDGKCTEYIEGYRYIPYGSTWKSADGKVIEGKTIFPWKPWNELDAAQREYERQEAADMREALALLGVNVDE